MSDLRDFLETSKKGISLFLLRYLNATRRRINVVDSRWAEVTLKELGQFAVRGKMIRGGLVLLGARMFGRRIDARALALASAIEIMHSSLLVHDDIMDEDDIRRGLLTMHRRFEQIGEQSHLSNPRHFGISSAICAGDVGFFLSSDLVDRALKPNFRRAHDIRELFAQEVMKVGVAQIVEMRESMRAKPISEKQVLNIYLHKTARYTFSLPLLMGAMSAGATRQKTRPLEKFGEHVGMLFQIQDDYIGLFGDPRRTGKTVGSDIVSGKKTLYYTLLMKRASSVHAKRLKRLLGRPRLNKTDIAFVRGLLLDYGIIRDVQTMKDRLSRFAFADIDRLPVQKAAKEMLRSLVLFNTSRNA